MRPKPISLDRIRTIPKSFSWIDHRFITHGLIESLSKEEIILYYFLVTVGDKNGISYYHPDTICQLLKLDSLSFSRARDNLTLKDLITYRNRIYQVLSLPEEPPRETSSPMRISQIFKSISVSNTRDG